MRETLTRMGHFEGRVPLCQSNLLVHNLWWLVLVFVPTSRRSLVLVTRLAARARSNQRFGGSKMPSSVVLERKLGGGSGPEVRVEEYDFRTSPRLPRSGRGSCMDQIKRREQLIESYLRGLTEHLGDLEEYLRELQREREELEREWRDLDLRLKANEEERVRVLGYIEEIPRLRDRTLRSLLRNAEELGSGRAARDE